jgi:hypothetical protein
MKLKNNLSIIWLLTLLSINCQASYISITAEGTDNIPDGFNEGSGYSLDLNDPAANFFKIYFESGNTNEYISKISINLQAGLDTDAFFDPSDGQKVAGINDNGGGKGFGPVIGAETQGINPSDVSFSLGINTGTSPILEIFFNSTAFKVGSLLSFGIDIDKLNDNLNNQGGGLLGTQKVGITTTIKNSCTETIETTFIKKSRNKSESIIDICAQPAHQTTLIAEPTILQLLLFSMVLIQIIISSKKFKQLLPLLRKY